jgi:hypothetical protein
MSNNNETRYCGTCGNRHATSGDPCRVCGAAYQGPVGELDEIMQSYQKASGYAVAGGALLSAAVVAMFPEEIKVAIGAALVAVGGKTIADVIY